MLLQTCRRLPARQALQSCFIIVLFVVPVCGNFGRSFKGVTGGIGKGLKHIKVLDAPKGAAKGLGKGIKTIEGAPGKEIQRLGGSLQKLGKGAGQDLKKDMKVVGGVAEHTVKAPVAAVRKTSDTIGHIDHAARSADQTLQNADQTLHNLQPAIQHLDGVAQRMDSAVQTAVPTLDKVGLAAESIDHLSNISEPVLLDIDDAAVSAARLMNSSNPVVQHLGEAVKKTDALLTGTAAALRNMTDALSSFGRDADAARPTVQQLDRSLQKAGTVADQTTMVMKGLDRMLPVIMNLVAIILCLCIFILLGKCFLTGRLLFGSRSMVRNLDSSALQGGALLATKALPSEMSEMRQGFISLDEQA